MGRTTINGCIKLECHKKNVQDKEEDGNRDA